MAVALVLRLLVLLAPVFADVLPVLTRIAQNGATTPEDLFALDALERFSAQLQAEVQAART